MVQLVMLIMWWWPYVLVDVETVRLLTTDGRRILQPVVKLFMILMSFFVKFERVLGDLQLVGMRWSVVVLCSLSILVFRESWKESYLRDGSIW